MVSQSTSVTRSALSRPRCLGRRAAARYVVTAAAEHEQQHGQQQQIPQQLRHHQQPVKTAGSRATGAAVAAAPLLALAAAGAAWAEEDGPQYAYPAPDDPVVTIMFTAAIGLLSIVTLGVRLPRPHLTSRPDPLSAPRHSHAGSLLTRGALGSFTPSAPTTDNLPSSRSTFARSSTWQCCPSSTATRRRRTRSRGRP